jgi:hypothetical protein
MLKIGKVSHVTITSARTSTKIDSGERDLEMHQANKANQ